MQHTPGRWWWGGGLERQMGKLTEEVNAMLHRINQTKPVVEWMLLAVDAFVLGVDPAVAEAEELARSSSTRATKGRIANRKMAKNLRKVWAE